VLIGLLTVHRLFICKFCAVLTSKISDEMDYNHNVDEIMD